jgi:capsid protein
LEAGYIDGIRFDANNNILWYDVLPFHPGASQQFLNSEPVRVPPRDMLHWFKLTRPGAHRGIPALTSTLNLGASSRRFREATLAKAESQADFTVLLRSLYEPAKLDQTEAMDAFQAEKRMIVTLPNNLDPVQLENNTPNVVYPDFLRSQISEQTRPISMPFNAAACDSSTYSFASGKLDTLCYRSEINVERADADELVMNPLFAVWFAEWRLVNSGVTIPEEDLGPAHQWDWPAHPVIDAEAESRATDIQLKNGTQTLREAYSAQGRDYEDELAVMAEDWFGDNSDASIDKARKINLLRNLPAHVIPYAAPLAGVELPAPPQTLGGPPT